MEVLQRALLVCVAALAISTVCNGIVDEALNLRCQAQGSCADCIRESPDCGWCSDVTVPDRRCNAIDRENPGASTCSVLQDPKGEVVSTSNDTFENFNQIIPRTTAVNVRPGAPVEFTVSVKPANNFPIDLYLLMDLSFSMNDDLQNLKTLGTSIAERIRSISTNFRIGFGAFVDKPLGSFINLSPTRLTDPCGGGCDAPYSYRHIVSLTDDDEEFSDQVQAQTISGNQDFPEGGFDGLLQSIVCTNVIGWRDVSRKILLYISDAGFHFAGDGLLGGVVKPNNGECQMTGITPNSDGTIDYASWDTLDFPSIGQIAEKLDEFDVIPLFAVVEQFQDLYRLLTNELGDRAYLGTLASDSGNVVDLVEQLYIEISERIVFTPQNIPGVTISVTPLDCSAGRVVAGVCQDVDIGELVTFDVSVEVTECTDDLIAGPQDIELRVVGFGAITVSLTAICSCDCDEQRVDNSADCNTQGTLVCGICECNTGFFGDKCQCDNSGTASGMTVECPSGLENLECSGRGTCTCGICECRRDTSGEERFYGVACECDNTVCARGFGNEICSGATRGECTCDGCRCLNEPVTGLPYSRSDCSCTPNTQTCVDPTNTTDICNDRGTCECGECLCRAPYFGDFCERCSGDNICIQEICDVNGDNALCASCVVDLLAALNDAKIGSELFTEDGLKDAMSMGTLPAESQLTTVMNNDMMMAVITLPEGFSTNCSMKISAACPQLVIANDTLVLDYQINGEATSRCNQDQSGCTYQYYVVLLTEDTAEIFPIHVEYPPMCRQRSSGSSLAIPPWSVALILIVLLLLLGLLALILLKILLMILDYIEVRKFERELERVKYTKNENPLYHSAAKDYKNPIYGQ